MDKEAFNEVSFRDKYGIPPEIYESFINSLMDETFDVIDAAALREESLNKIIQDKYKGVEKLFAQFITQKFVSNCFFLLKLR
jgi:hypothetical protein